MRLLVPGMGDIWCQGNGSYTMVKSALMLNWYPSTVRYIQKPSTSTPATLTIAIEDKHIHAGWRSSSTGACKRTGFELYWIDGPWLSHELPRFNTFLHSWHSQLIILQVHRSIPTKRQQGGSLYSASKSCHGQMMHLAIKANNTTLISTFVHKTWTCLTRSWGTNISSTSVQHPSTQVLVNNLDHLLRHGTTHFSEDTIWCWGDLQRLW